MKRYHGSYKCQICLIKAKSDLTWANSPSKRERCIHRLGNSIPPAKYRVQDVWMCGSCKSSYLNPKFIFMLISKKLKASNAKNRN